MLLVLAGRGVKLHKEPEVRLTRSRMTSRTRGVNLGPETRTQGSLYRALLGSPSSPSFARRLHPFVAQFTQIGNGYTAGSTGCGPWERGGQ